MDDPGISGRSLILPNIFPITLHLFGLFPGKSLSKFCVKSTSLQFEASVNNFYPENIPSFTFGKSPTNDRDPPDGNLGNGEAGSIQILRTRSQPQALGRT